MKSRAFQVCMDYTCEGHQDIDYLSCVQSSNRFWTGFGDVCVKSVQQNAGIRCMTLRLTYCQNPCCNLYCSCRLMWYGIACRDSFEASFAKDPARKSPADLFTGDIFWRFVLIHANFLPLLGAATVCSLACMHGSSFQITAELFAQHEKIPIS